MQSIGGPEGRDAGTRGSDDTEALINGIADSVTFKAAPKMRALLLYLWQHRNEPISEYAIAVEALGRRPDFDSKIDATVRVEIARLRRKLKEFYETEGDSTPLRLSIPLGGHSLESLSARRARRLVDRRMAIALALGLSTVILGGFCLFLLKQNRQLKAGVPQAVEPLHPLWQSFFGKSTFTSVVIPSPTHFFWPDRLLQLRDMTISDFSDWSTSPALRELSKQWGTPQLDQRFVFTRDMFAAVKLLEYFQRHGKRAELAVSTNLPVDYASDRNVVFVGGPRSTGRLRDSLSHANFFIAASNPTVIRNKDPQPGEPAEFRESVQSDQRRTCPGMIILPPRTREGSRSIVFVGRYPSTLVQLLVSADGLNSIERQWSKIGRPDAWEMVVQADIHNETALKVWPMALRKLAPNAP